ncbi:MAG TPA: acyl-CoA dehydrogenase family protein [Thermoanaerobaculia bacterium]|nr:acyl-CoA dehydrogenase family protein [Thermoanaerobaculia bacterium]
MEARLESPAALQSPMRALMAGQVPEDILFPFPGVSAEERETMAAFLDSFRSFARDRIDSAKIEREHRISEDVVAGLAALGAFGMTIPEQYGGYGFSASAYCRVMEEVGTVDASLAILIGAHLSIGIKGLLLYGNEEQKKRWLPSLATGEMLGAFALTEPEAGSDAASIRTTADYDEATQTFVVNGTKHWISNGGFADFFTVFARDTRLEGRDQHRGITAFVVTKDLGGVTPGKEERKLGLKGSSTTPVELVNVRVPAFHVLGERGQGFKIAVEVLNTGRTSLGAGCVGGSKAMIRLAAKHATQRRQFKTRIADFEMIRAKFARMVATTYAIESLVYLTAGLVDRGLPDYALEGACCKVLGTEAAWQTINDALQIAGGNGFMEEYPYEKALRDSRINMIFEGTNEILRVLVALSGMRDVGEDLKEVGKAIRAPLSSLGILSDYAARKFRSVAPAKLTRNAPELAKEAEVVSRYTAAAANVLERVVRRHGKGILEKEYQQERAANIVMDLYACLAVISRATSAVAAKGSEKAAGEVRLAKAFVQSAKYRIVGQLKEMDRNVSDPEGERDARNTKISDDAYEKLAYPFNYWE